MTLRLIKGSGPGCEAGPYRARQSDGKTPLIRLLAPGGGHRIIDLRRHRETYKGFKIEVWQIADTCGTARPRFYTVRYNLEAKKKVPRRGTSEFTELDAAIRYIKRRADRWRYLLDHRPRTTQPARPQREPRKALPIYKAPEQLGPPITISDITNGDDSDAATCPACDKIVSRSFMALTAHLNAHVRRRVITEDRKHEIMGQLVRRGRRAVV